MPLAGRLHKLITQAAADECIEPFLSLLHALHLRHQCHILLTPGRQDKALAEYCAIPAALEHHAAARSRAGHTTSEDAAASYLAAGQPSAHEPECRMTRTV